MTDFFSFSVGNLFFKLFPPAVFQRMSFAFFFIISNYTSPQLGANKKKIFLSLMSFFLVPFTYVLSLWWWEVIESTSSSSWRTDNFGRFHGPKVPRDRRPRVLRNPLFAEKVAEEFYFFLPGSALVLLFLRSECEVKHQTARFHQFSS